MAYIEGTDLRPTDKMRNIWGMPTISAPEFYQLPDPEGSIFDQATGGRGRGSFSMNAGRAPLLTSGFGDTLNLGGGPMPPAQALHEFNLERNKYTDPKMQEIQSIFSGEADARKYYLANQAKFLNPLSSAGPLAGAVSPGGGYSRRGGSSAAAAQRAASIARVNSGVRARAGNVNYYRGF